MLQEMNREVRGNTIRRRTIYAVLNTCLADWKVNVFLTRLQAV